MSDALRWSIGHRVRFGTSGSGASDLETSGFVLSLYNGSRFTISYYVGPGNCAFSSGEIENCGIEPYVLFQRARRWDDDWSNIGIITNNVFDSGHAIEQRLGPGQVLNVEVRIARDVLEGGLGASQAVGRFGIMADTFLPRLSPALWTEPMTVWFDPDKLTTCS